MNSLESNTIRVYMNEVSKIAILTPEQERELFFKIKNGSKEAKEQMLKSNLRLVIANAKKYLYSGLSFEDLIQEGNLGLLNAIENYDVEKGKKFSTYATWYINGYIMHALASKSRLIRIPENLVEKNIKLRKLVKKFIDKHHRVPTVKEVSKMIDLPEKKIKLIMEVFRKPVSLNIYIDKNDEKISLGDIVQDLLEVHPFEKIASNSLKRKTLEILDKLSYKERLIIKMYFGIDYEKSFTLCDLGKYLNMSKSRVQQLKNMALEKLKRLYKKNNMEMFLVS